MKKIISLLIVLTVCFSMTTVSMAKITGVKTKGRQETAVNEEQLTEQNPEQQPEPEVTTEAAGTSEGGESADGENGSDSGESLRVSVL
ncbi:MAG: hypothetical protein HUJ76_10765, partial [Parasporobacterium sp.]|nr:hypothetical protein [Parasporobacterium sp.]